VTQPLNYCTQAAENLTIFQDDLFSKGGELAVAIAASARDVLILMHEAEKFILPPWGKIFSRDEMDMLDDLKMATRLPYPIIAIEYHCPYDDPRCDPLMKHEVPSSKRIALCVETEAIQEHTDLLANMDDKVGSGPGFYVFPVSYIDSDDTWTPPPACMFFPRGGNKDLKNLGQSIILPLGSASYGAYPKPEQPTRVARDIADEVFAALHLLMALALDKGRHEVLPAPTKLNKKREKRDRPPLYEYKVLDIVADVLHSPHFSSKPHQGGTHASPRMHKRRGHVRRLRSGRTTWVRNMIVGKPTAGAVEKEYSVHE